MTSNPISFNETRPGIKIIFFNLDNDDPFTILDQTWRNPINIDPRTGIRTYFGATSIFTYQSNLPIYLIPVILQDNFRTIINQGLHGLILFISGSKLHWETIKTSLKETLLIVSEKIASGQVTLQIILNKMELQSDQRISYAELINYLAGLNIFKHIRKAIESVFDVSYVKAIEDLEGIKNDGKFNSKDRKFTKYYISRFIFPFNYIFINVIPLKKNGLIAISTLDYPPHNKEQLDQIVKKGGFPDYEAYKKSLSVGAINRHQWEIVCNYKVPDYKTAKKIIDGGFLDYKQLKYAQSLGAETLEQLELINKLNSPDYKTALEIKEKNFPNYDIYQQALNLGATRMEEYKLIIDLGAPDFVTTQKVISGEFVNYEKYLHALKMKASNLSEFNLTVETGAPNYPIAKELMKNGFHNYKEYKIARKEGFLIYNDWVKKETIKKSIIEFLAKGKNISLKKFIKKLDLNNEQFLNIYISFPKNLIEIKDKALFFKKSSINDVITTQINNILCYELSNTIERKNSDLFIEKIENPKRNSIISPMSKNEDNCHICLKPVNDEIGTCPYCKNTFHLNHLKMAIILKEKCPTCRNVLFVNQIIVSKLIPENFYEKKTCFLCKRLINDQEAEKCQFCSETFHKSEFHEYEKIKGECPSCQKRII